MRNDGGRFHVENTRQHIKEKTMPVFLMWAIPAVIVIGGGGYYLVHMHMLH